MRATCRRHFNPRSPCGERLYPLALEQCQHGFQSTLPVRGATFCKRRSSGYLFYFNPRSPCGERRSIAISALQERKISIHAPRAGSDREPHCTLRPCSDISIHAPRAGSDKHSIYAALINTHISIHAPRAGSDRARGGRKVSRVGFQSTLPVRGATYRRRGRA